MVDASSKKTSGTQRRAASALPWAVSLGVHVALILLGFTLTWTIIRMEERAPAPIVEAGLPAADLSAVVEVQPLELPGPGPAPSPPTPVPDIVQELPPRQAQAPLELPAGPVGAIPMATLFAGSDLPPGDVVFVLDASGTMIPWFHDVIAELERALKGMRPTDEFAVVLFKGDEAIVAYPGRPHPAKPRHRARALEFLRDYNRWGGGPGLGSDPVKALQTAIAFDPSTIVLLSAGMDASTSFSLDTEEVLEALRQASAAASAGGASRTHIQCVQLVEDAQTQPDPLLSAIAHEHGGGPVHLVTYEELDP